MHRAESILEAVKTTLTGLTTTGTNVERSRVYPPDSLPALSINKGKDEREPNPSTMGTVESNIEIKIVVYVKSEAFTTDLNQICAEVYAAMMASNRLGLAYVEKLRWIEDSEPESSGESETITTQCVITFEVGYTHALTSKES